MMKRKGFPVILILIAIFLFCVLLSFLPGKDILGRYRTLDQARYGEYANCYKGGVLIHTEKTEDRYTDFVIYNDTFYVIRFKSSDTVIGEKYKFASSSENKNFFDTVAKDSEDFLQEGIIDFESAGGKLELALDGYESANVKTILWCVLTADCVVEDSNTSVYPFEYAGEEYILCIALEN